MPKKSLKLLHSDFFNVINMLIQYNMLQSEVTQ